MTTTEKNSKETFRERIKYFFNYVFIDGMSGMALGLFATLIVGTIMTQVGAVIPGVVGKYIVLVFSVAKSMTGAGIGAGVAYKYKMPPLVVFASAVSGMVGAFAPRIITGDIVDGANIILSGPGEPLGAFIAALVAIAIGRLVSAKTKVDILVTPILSICAGAAAGLLVGPPISKFMTALGGLINWGTVQQPILMGVIVSVLMGIVLTLPISSAAIGIILGLTGLSSGAAVAGCSAQMIGFAVMSYRENKMGGLFAQGIGTSMIQMPNIMKKPVIWIPPIIASAILGPVSTAVFGMTCNPTGSGMGTSGIVGQIMTYQTMTAEGVTPFVVLSEIVLMHFIAPALITLLISEFMRKKGWIKPGDLKLSL